MKCHTSHNSGIWRCFCAVALLLTLASATCANAQTTPTYYAAACGTGGGTAGTICLAGTGATPEAAAAPVAKGVDNFMVNTYDSPNGNGTAATSYYQVSNSTYQGCHLQNQAPPAGVGGNFCGFHWTMQPTELCQNYLANQCVPETPTNMGETVLVTVTTTAPAGYNANCGQADTGYQYAQVPGTSGQPPPSIMEQTQGAQTGCAVAVYGCVYEQPIGSLPGTYICNQQYTGTNYTQTPTSQPPATPAAGNCATAGKQTDCISPSTDGCGTVNGNQVCPQAIAPGSCVSYASGAVACGVAAAADAPQNPPGPTTSTGAAAPAAAAVTDTPNTQCSGTCQSSTAYYYTHTTVQSSSGAVSTTSTQAGNPSSTGAVPTSTTGTGTGGGGGLGGCAGTTGDPCTTAPVPNAANGDCGASANAANCTTTGSPLPSVNWTGDSWSGSTTAFVNAVETGPIGTAVTGLSNAWPSGGSCPAETVKLTTLNYTADYGTPLCNIWQSAALPILSDTMLAIWSIAAVIVFMSA